MSRTRVILQMLERAGLDAAAKRVTEDASAAFSLQVDGRVS